MANISIWQLLILLLIVVLVFGTKRLRNIGSDLGNAVKGFREGMEDKNEDGDEADRRELGSGEESVTQKQKEHDTAHQDTPSKH